jgi:hypothetical protein
LTQASKKKPLAETTGVVLEHFDGLRLERLDLTSWRDLSLWSFAV